MLSDWTSTKFFCYVQWNSIVMYRSYHPFGNSARDPIWKSLKDPWGTNFSFRFRFLLTLSSSVWIVRYLHLLIKKRMQSVNIGPNFCSVLQLEEGEVEWLGLNAYVQVLKRKQSRHKELLSLLRSKLSAHRITGNVSCPLNYAIDKTHSSSIWKIKY